MQENEFQKNITKWLKLLERVLSMRINFGGWEVPDAEVWMVEGTHERTTGRVVIGAGVSDEFGIHIGLRQGSALSPLLFIVVLELISRNVTMKDEPRKLLHSDDLAIVYDNKHELQVALEEWKDTVQCTYTEHGEDGGIMDRTVERRD